MDIPRASTLEGARIEPIAFQQDRVTRLFLVRLVLRSSAKGLREHAAYARAGRPREPVRRDG